MNTGTDRVELKLPFKAKYVSVARLTVSGIANRLGFDIDLIEDIKVAVAEICNNFVNIGSEKAENYDIVFIICEDKLSIIFDCEDKSLKQLFNNEIDELAISIITALMDEVKTCPDNSYFLLMSKSVERDI